MLQRTQPPRGQPGSLTLERVSYRGAPTHSCTYNFILVVVIILPEVVLLVINISGIHTDEWRGLRG